MKRILVSVLVLALVALALTPALVQAAAPKATPKASARKLYVCTMCDYASDGPGKCAKCGMNLEEVNKADVSYTCDRCGVTADKPGKCPKCGMELRMKVASAQSPAPKVSQPQKG
jgi:rubrerythrin